MLLDSGSGSVVSHLVVGTRRPITSLALKTDLLFVSSEDSFRVYNWHSGELRELQMGVSSPGSAVVCCVGPYFSCSVCNLIL